MVLQQELQLRPNSLVYKANSSNVSDIIRSRIQLGTQSPIRMLPINLRFRTYLELLVLVGADLDPVLHVVQVFPFPFPAVLRGHLVPDLPSDLLQIALLLPERKEINSFHYVPVPYVVR